jgi:hypothetical protein
MDISAPNMTAAAETVEAESLYAYVTDAPTILGTATARIAGGVATSMLQDDTGFWTRTVGLGVTEPVTAAALDEVVAFYRAAGASRATVQIAPEFLPPDWHEITAAHGIEAGRFWVKLGAPVEAIRLAPTDSRRAPLSSSAALKTAPLPSSEVDTWAEVILDSFGMRAEGMRGLLAAAAASPDCRPFAAWSGDTLVSGANLYVRGESASLNGAGTRPGHRGQGAQSALIAARAGAAAEAGCRLLFAETGLPSEGTTNPSLDNLRRLGLQDLYARQNWIWSASRAG